MCTPQSGPLRDVQSFTEKRRGRKEIDVAKRIKGGIKRRETDPASNQFPKCFPPSGTQTFTELGREEKGDGEDRGDLREKKESQKGERVIKPVITLLNKMGTEDWILKATKLITNTKKQRLKI